MSIKNILVALAPGRGNDAGRKYAISMGAKLGAHVTGAVYALQPELRGVHWLADDLVERSRVTVVEEAKAAAAAFKEAAKAARLDVTAEISATTLAAGTRDFAEEARVHDVAVLTQSRPGLEYVGDVFLEAGLFHSGRPVIVVPKARSVAFSAERVLIAWDGSAHAARAVALSMSLLASNSKIKVVVVGNAAKVEASRAKALVINLGRNGFETKLVIRNHHDDAGTIAREAKTWKASLIVMGGYGGSKLREVMFGGVTRYMLMKTPTPVLMAH